MSDIGTATDKVGTVNGTPDGETTAAKLKHIGISLLPLALFMASTLGTEYFTQRRAVTAPKAVQPTLSAKPAAGIPEASDRSIGKAAKAQPATALSPPQTAAVVPQTKSLAVPENKPVAPPSRTMADLANVLRDERSLLELSRIEAARSPSSVPASVAVPAAVEVAAAAAVPAVVPPPAVPLGEPTTVHRFLETTADSAVSLPLGFKIDRDYGTGGYAILRGVPQPAILSHGISVGDESWLIDGIDIPRAAIDLRVRSAGKIVLDLAVLTATSALIHREILTVEVKPTAVAAPAITPSHVPVVESTAAPQPRVEIAAASQAAAGPPGLARSAPQTEVEKPAVPAAPVPAVRISRETNLTPGRGGLLRLDIEPASAIPKGAFVMVRGLPTDTVMSRGIPMGPDTWLLTLDELPGLEVRLPAKTAGAVRLIATLMTSDGNLIAEERYEIPVANPVANPVAAKPQTAVAALPAPAAPTAPPAAAAAPAQIVTRAIQPAATKLAPPPANAPASTATPGQVALARGRRMLDLGNIAAARPMLERSALEGSGDAAALLAASFDSEWLKKAGAVGIAADATKASYWYDEARKLGTNDIERITGALLRR